MSRSLFFSLSILLLALTAGCGGDQPTQAATTSAAPPKQEPPPLPEDVQSVATATAATATIVPANASQPSVAEATGNTLVATGEFISPIHSQLAPKIGGRVARMYVDEGSRVTRGQPVLALETDYIRLSLQQAEAELARATAMANEAARDLDRKKELIAKESIPRATYDRSQAAFEQAQAARASAQAQVAIFRQQLSDSVVRAPISGVVADKRTDVGQRLGDGDVAVVVVQLSPLKLRFRVPERYLGKVQRGDRVSARVEPYPNEVFAGTIRTLGGVIDPATRTMFAEAEFPNSDGRLRPGLFARVETKLN